MSLFLEPVSEGQKIPIDKAVVFFGRHPDCDVVLTRSRKVSRKHCCIAQVDNRLVIRDLGSMNGIKVNGKRVIKVKDLSLGDKVTIGDVVYRLKNSAVVSETAKKKEPSDKKTVKSKPSPKPVQKKKKPEQDLGMSMDFPISLDEEDEEENSNALSETNDKNKEEAPSSLPLASLSQIEDDEEYDELGADDIVDEDEGDFFEEFDDQFEDEESDDDIIILDD
jgi:pSer/pThr/pTyr-binding forkhead associated (FHA) protein